LKFGDPEKCNSRSHVSCVNHSKTDQGQATVNFVPLSEGQTGPVDALLAAYATGSLSRPLHALVASHLSLRADNRSFVNSLECLIADDIAAMDIKEHVAGRDDRLAAIFRNNGGDSAEAELGSEFLPPPLGHYLGMPYDALPWRAVMPGLKEVKLEDGPGCEAAMLWIRAGRTMPSHTHPGIEATLVLKGSFEDATGVYSRGDMAVVDSDVDHKPVAGADEDCICFAVSEGPVKLTGPIARLFQRLIRH
jgi:putative transcriptional regulator